MTPLIGGILGGSSVSQVIGAVVEVVPVQVANYHSAGPWAQEDLSDEPMNGFHALPVRP
jgi:hypothetical protein